VLLLLWAIFIAEGNCRASVPFGWLPLRDKWRRGEVSFWTVMRAVAQELRREYDKWRKAVNEKGYEGDFIRWLAEVGYNANPSEWRDWERNVRYYAKRLEVL